MRTGSLLAYVAIAMLALAPHDGSAQTSSDLGHVEFPNSGAAEAQEPFIRGLLLLHSFTYVDAAEAFREAQSLDPDFAMAYWGEAMTYNHPVWQEQDREAALEALNRLASTPEGRLAAAPTQREKDYLATLEILYGDGDKLRRDLAYADAMRELHKTYPDDPEAATFYALALLGTAHEGRDFETYMRAAAVADDVFRDNDEHPGAAHYLIHSFDDPIHAPLGLRAARAYAKIAPGASHAQHMTSHIFVALGMWDEVVSANETAVAVADHRVERKGLGHGARNYHALHWLAYGYMQQGRYGDAGKLLETMRGYAEASGSRRARSYFSRMRAHYILNTHGWEDGAVGVRIDVDDLGALRVAEYLFTNGFAALHSGDKDGATEAWRAMKERREAAAAGEVGYPPSLQGAEVLEKELHAMLLIQDGFVEEAVKSLREATEIEDSMPFEFGPPYVVKPSHELLGGVMLALGDADEAVRHFEASLARTPRRTESLIGLARALDAKGESQKANAIREELRAIWHSADPDLRELSEIAAN